MIFRGIVLICLLTLQFSLLIKGQSNVEYGQCDDIRQGFFHHYYCTLQCFGEVLHLSYVKGDLCKGTVELASNQKSPVPLPVIGKVIECITVRCKSAIPPSVCGGENGPVKNNIASQKSQENTKYPPEIQTASVKMKNQPDPGNLPPYSYDGDDGNDEDDKYDTKNNKDKKDVTNIKLKNQPDPGDLPPYSYDGDDGNDEDDNYDTHKNKDKKDVTNIKFKNQPDPGDLPPYSYDGDTGNDEDDNYDTKNHKDKKDVTNKKLKNQPNPADLSYFVYDNEYDAKENTDLNGVENTEKKSIKATATAKSVAYDNINNKKSDDDSIKGYPNDFDDYDYYDDDYEYYDEEEEGDEKEDKGNDGKEIVVEKTSAAEETKNKFDKNSVIAGDIKDNKQPGNSDTDDFKADDKGENSGENDDLKITGSTEMKLENDSTTKPDYFKTNSPSKADSTADSKDYNVGESIKQEDKEKSTKVESVVGKTSENSAKDSDSTEQKDEVSSPIKNTKDLSEEKIEYSTPTEFLQDSSSPKTSQDSSLEDTSQESVSSEATKDSSLPESSHDSSSPETSQDSSLPETYQDSLSPKTSEGSPSPVASQGSSSLETSNDSLSPKTSQDSLSPEISKDSSSSEISQDSSYPDTSQDFSSSEISQDSSSPESTEGSLSSTEFTESSLQIQSSDEEISAESEDTSKNNDKSESSNLEKTDLIQTSETSLDTNKVISPSSDVSSINNGNEDGDEDEYEYYYLYDDGSPAVPPNKNEGNTGNDENANVDVPINKNVNVDYQSNSKDNFLNYIINSDKTEKHYTQPNVNSNYPPISNPEPNNFPFNINNKYGGYGGKTVAFTNSESSPEAKITETDFSAANAFNKNNYQLSSDQEILRDNYPASNNVVNLNNQKSNYKNSLQSPILSKQQYPLGQNPQIYNMLQNAYPTNQANALDVTQNRQYSYNPSQNSPPYQNQFIPNPYRNVGYNLKGQPGNQYLGPPALPNQGNNWNTQYPNSKFAQNTPNRLWNSSPKSNNNQQIFQPNNGQFLNYDSSNLPIQPSFANTRTLPSQVYGQSPLWNMQPESAAINQPVPWNRNGPLTYQAPSWSGPLNNLQSANSATGAQTYQGQLLGSDKGLDFADTNGEFDIKLGNKVIDFNKVLQNG